MVCDCKFFRPPYTARHDFTDQEMLFSVTAVNELMRRAEEVVTRTSYGDIDYLRTLLQCMKGGEKEALNRLKLARAVLAKYYARCIIGNVS